MRHASIRLTGVEKIAQLMFVLPIFKCRELHKKKVMAQLLVTVKHCMHREKMYGGINEGALTRV